MANMSYCAFENTTSDLRQCLTMMYEAQEDGMNLDDFIQSRSSEYEKRAVEQLLAVIEEITELAERMADM